MLHRFGRRLTPGTPPPPSDEAAVALRALAAARPAPERLSPERAEALFARALAASAEAPIRQRRGSILGSRPRRAFTWASAAVVAAYLGVVSVDFGPPPPRTPVGTVGMVTSPKIAARPETTATPPGPAFIAPRHAHALVAPRQGRHLATRPRRRSAPRWAVAGPPVLSRPAARRRQRAARLVVAAQPLRDAAAPDPVMAAPLLGVIAPPVSSPPARAALREGEMIVRVTQRGGGDAQPLTAVIVRDAPASAPGFAQAAALRPGADRQPVWAQCTVSSEANSPSRARLVLIAQAPPQQP